MNILLKNAFKNTFGKPLRTILVIFSIFVCSLAAMLCFDLSGAIGQVLMDDVRSVSDADYQLILRPGYSIDMPEGFPEHTALAVYLYGERYYTDVPGEYNYAKSNSVRVLGLDFEKAAAMKFMGPAEVGYMEAIITEGYAKKNNCGVGDTITLHDKADEAHDYKVVKILPSDQKNPLMSQESVIVNTESAKVLYCGDETFGLLMIDVHDNELAPQAKEMLIEKYGESAVADLLVPEEIIAMIDNLTAILSLVFVITFLLVIFVTYSICERIVSERMSLVGTLRSLGMSSAGTARILLAENVIYALTGSIPAVVLYAALRTPALNLILRYEDGDGVMIMPKIPAVSVILLIAVVLGAVLVECLIPLRAILKALKVSIRDIIFDNRDTEYKYSTAGTITGAILLGIAAVLFFFRSNLILAALCMLFAVTGLAFIFPLVFKLFMSLLGEIAEKRSSARWSLALKEAVSRKSTVKSGILCATSACMCVIVFAIAMSAISTFAVSVFKADVKVDCKETPSKYSFIKDLEGVTDIENIYDQSDLMIIGDNAVRKNYHVTGIPEGGYKYYDMFRNLPGKVEDGTFYVHSSVNEKLGLTKGDKLTVTFNADYVFNIKKDMTFGGTFDTVSAADGKDSVVISRNDFIKIFHDLPNTMLVNCADPEKTAFTINKYTTGDETAKTRATIEEEDRRDAASAIAIFTTVIGIAIVMTGIGMISNQIIGFEGRKKELAVMLSCAMDRKTLAKVLFSEIFSMSAFASGLGVITGTLITLVLKSAVVSMEGVFFDLTLTPLSVIVLWVVMTILYTLTVFFPIAKMRKMKISEQIKYE